MIRLATAEDRLQIVDLASKFWLETLFSEPFDPDHCLIAIDHTIDNEFCAVIEIDNRIVGFSAAILSPSIGTPLAVIATELAWWVEPDFRKGRNGIALLKFMEQLAQEKGVKYWTMVAMQSSMPDQVCAMYEKLGYSKSEICYTKVF